MGAERADLEPVGREPDPITDRDGGKERRGPLALRQRRTNGLDQTRTQSDADTTTEHDEVDVEQEAGELTRPGERVDDVGPDCDRGDVAGIGGVPQLDDTAGDAGQTHRAP